MHHRCFAPRVDRVILLPPAHACLLLRLEMPSERQLVTHPALGLRGRLVGLLGAFQRRGER